MNRCPNHKCRQQCDPARGFCASCGIAVRLCSACRQEGALTFNRADGFYCRRCGGANGPTERTLRAPVEFSRERTVFRASTRLLLNERSDSFPLATSQAHLLLLTSNNKLRVIENRDSALTLSDGGSAKHVLAEMQSQITQLEPQSAPVVVRDRAVIFGARAALSFSIHPHANRWLRQQKEIELPAHWQPLFNSEAASLGARVELPVALAEKGQFAIASIALAALKGDEPMAAQPVSKAISALLIGPLDSDCRYYWAKDLKQGTGQVFYVNRAKSGIDLVKLNIPPLHFLARPVLAGERLYAVTEDHRLVEIALQRGETVNLRKLRVADRGARAIAFAGARIVVAARDALFFFDHQTGELAQVAEDIDTSHLFVDQRGWLMAVVANGKLVMINSDDPLERWGDDDASSDDSRIFDAFISYNSLYTLSENGEVCRFDFN